MDKIIYLKAQDDFPRIRAYMEWMDARRFLLVVPGNSPFAKDLVKLKALQRRAESLGKECAIVSQDAEIRSLAKEALIRVFISVSMAKRAKWIASEILPEYLPEIYEREESAPPPSHSTRRSRKIWNRLWAPPARKINWLQQIAFFVGMVFAGVALIISLLLTYPGATVKISPASIPIEAVTAIKADPSVELIDAEKSIIPAHLVQVDMERSESIAVSSTKDAPVDRAKGPVVFINRSGQEVTIPISTTVSSSQGNPVRYTTAYTVTVPAGSGQTANGEVIARDPGPVGNLAAFQINRFDDAALDLKVRVINEQPMTGGNVRQAGVVTQADKDRVQAVLLQKIQEEGYTQLKQSLSSKEFVPPESVEVIILSLTFDKFAGDIADTIGLQMRAVVRGTAFSSDNTNQLAFRDLLRQLPAGYQLASDTLHFEVNKVIDVKERVVSLEIKGQAQAYAELNADDISKYIAWLGVDEAKEALRNHFPLNSEPEITVQPDWLGRLPYFPFRITVSIDKGAAGSVAGAKP